MRRRDREITDSSRIAEILQAGQAVSIAFGGETPYVIPMSYGFACKEGRFTLYMHGAGEGEKIERVKADPRAAFTVFTGNQVYGEGSLGCTYSTSFDSVCGAGRIRLLEADEEKRKGLAAIMAHVAPGKAFTFEDGMVRSTCVMALDVETITGKHHD